MIDVLFEDNHLLVVNKRVGELVQPDPSGEPALEQAAAEYLRVKYNKPGKAFLGVVHRLDRPVSGAVLFAKTSKALVRLNKQLHDKQFSKIYWAIVEHRPDQDAGELNGYITRNAKVNKSFVSEKPTSAESKQAILRYKLIGSSDRYFLLEVELLTGRHHQIRAQLAHIGCPIKGDLKYGAKRSNDDGGISLHARKLTFMHPVSGEQVSVTAPVPASKLWQIFGCSF